jgi:ribonucleotide monophosphatase NagD (HAD superfamily)
VAIAGTSSIGGFWFLQNSVGTTAWKTLGATAIVIGALKHVFPVAERRLKKERSAVGYRMLEHELQCIRVGVKERRVYDDIAKAEFRIALRNKKELIAQSDGEPCSKQIIKNCRISVETELPVSEFFTPP